MEDFNQGLLSDRHYKELAEAVPQLLWSCRPDGNCEYFSPQWLEYTGIPLGEQLGFGWSRLLHPEDQQRALTAWRNAVAGLASYDLDYRLRSANGSYRWFRTRGLPIRNESGEIVKWYGSCTDIHDRKLAEQALELSNQVGAAMAAELDVDKIVQAVTDASTQATGAEFGSFFYNVTNSNGESYMLYTVAGVPREAFSKFPMPRNTAIFAPTFSGERIVRSDDIHNDPAYGLSSPHFGMPPGHLPVHSYLAVPVISRSEGVIGGLFFGHSQIGRFTEAHERAVASFASQAAVALDNARLVSSLRIINDELEQRVQERTAKLLRVVQDLEGFTHSVSHDLRSPLRGIVANAQMVLEDEGPNVSPAGKEQLKRLSQAANNMSDLVDDLLDFARLGSDDLHRSATDMAVLGQQVADTVSEFVEDTTITVSIPSGTDEWCDPRMLSVALQNLLENGSKYRPTGSHAEVQFGVVQTHEETRYFVRDNGVGFDMRYAEKIFEPFYRAPQETFFPGTGIGLANVKRIIDRHGGRIWAESELGKGATFWFTLR